MDVFILNASKIVTFRKAQQKSFRTFILAYYGKVFVIDKGE
ncbi:hypothetical protein TH47_05330 [Thalassospira sp. MCCC 1A02803]|nr:hypothetical protein TH47_05330 [Thalassospira sp. MCCC 1A02803]